jgi:hypothetical protein
LPSFNILPFQPVHRPHSTQAAEEAHAAKAAAEAAAAKAVYEAAAAAAAAEQKRKDDEEDSSVLMSAHQIPDDIIVLKERQGYEPTQEEIQNYAEWLGLVAEEDDDLMWIPRKAMRSSLPKVQRCTSELLVVGHFKLIFDFELI